MFYNFLAKRTKPHGDTKIGEMNSLKYYDKQLQIFRESGVLHGEVLEVGPGEGNFARQCKEAGLRYRGVERSPGLQVQLVEQGFDVLLGSAPPLPFEDEQFDFVCVMTVLEHMPTFNEAFDLLQECNRVLKPNGTLAIMVPDALRCGIDFYNWDYTHSFITTQFRVRQAIEDAGFQAGKAIHFTGSLTGASRIPADLLSFLVHTRFVYWLGTSMGLERWLNRFHKTFMPNFLVVSRKLCEDL